MRRSALALLLGCLLLVAGASALDGYDYYQTIEYAATDKDVYQQDIVIHRSAGTAYNETSGGLETWHIYVGDHCREDYGDIRFSDDMGQELAYYLWPDYDAESARFCVRLEGADQSGALTVWYGNPAATTASDGGSAYFIFDDFSVGTTPDPSIWVWDGTPPSIVDGQLKVTTGCVGLTSVEPIGAPEVWVQFQYTQIVASGSANEGYHTHGVGVGGSPNAPVAGIHFYPDGQYDRRVFMNNSGAWWSSSLPGRGTTSYTHITSIGFATDRLIHGSKGQYEFLEEFVGATGIEATHKLSIAQTTPYVSRTGVYDWILTRAYSATPPAALVFSGEQETAAPPTTTFTATPTAGLAPLTVQFTDLSGGRPTSWLWTFGDGNTSTDQNPQHTYATPGLYSVTLTATNEYGSDTETKTDYITVYAPVTAQFTANITGGTAPLTVQFTDLSTGGPTSWLWTFGDGNTSTNQNPVHTYTTAGAHTVTLTASHPYSSDTETKTAYITVAVLQPFPGITALPRDLNSNGLYTDINGNNRLDYNDLTVFFQHLAWAKANQPTECFDFNGNGWLDYNDVITLFTTISGEHT